MVDNTRVFNCDCLPAMREYPDKYFDLAIVDPPYGINRDSQQRTICKNAIHNRREHKKKDWDNDRPNQQYWYQLFRISINQIIWGGNYFTEFLPPSMGWVFWDKGQRISMSDGELAFTSFDRALRAVEYNRAEAREDGILHPTQKPVALYKWLLKNYAKEGDKILDTHLGSGSSRIAAFDMGFDFTGYELDKDYFEAQEKRFRQHKNQLTFDFSSSGHR